MSRQSIHVRIENSIYLALKAKQVNISGTVNNLLKNFVETEDIQTDESVLLDKIAEIKNKKKELDELLESEIVKLEIVRDQKEKERKEEEIKMGQFIASAKHNNPARDII